jgi:ABC-type multidrug transport system ATPase subunit
MQCDSSNDRQPWSITATTTSVTSSTHQPPVTMAAALLWRNLSVFEPSSGCHISAELKEEKRILKGINGAILYKSLNAIMGPSGAGKTTLLKCLFGTSSIKYTGSIFVGDRSTKAVFISQNEEDHLLLNLTVEESIRFACKVKNNSSCRLMSCIVGNSDKLSGDSKHSSDSDIVSSLIDQLDLERCRHTLARKCSGGQKKRLAIAQELASKIKPKIIFMDEPTSGQLHLLVPCLLFSVLSHSSVRDPFLSLIRALVL